MTPSPKTALLIKFNAEGVDIESVRELLEDNLGVQILSIDESEHFEEKWETSPFFQNSGGE